MACNGYLYVYGGHAGTAHQYSTATSLGTFQRLPLGGGEKWEELPGGPGLIGLNLAAVGGNVYRVGGMHARNARAEKADLISLTDVAVYDPTLKNWTARVPLPAGRSSHDVVSVGSKLVVVGGWRMGVGESVWADTALILDTALPNSKWEAIPQPFKRRALTAAAVGNKVYVLGGLTESGESIRKVDILDIATGQWSVGPEFPGTARTGFHPAAGVLEGSLYLNTMDRNIWRLTPDGKGWENVGTTVEARFVHRLIPNTPKSLLAVAGAGPKGSHATLEVVLPLRSAPATPPASGTVQRFCPVMTSDEVTPQDAYTVEYQGVKVLLCCNACVGKFNRDPAAYLDPVLLPQLADKTLPKRTLEQVYCPVYRDRKVSSRDSFVSYNGTKVYVFNEIARQRFEKNPEKYADPEVLPQLKKTK